MSTVPHHAQMIRVAGGFPDLPDANGTCANIDRALDQLEKRRCDVPDPMPMLPSPGELPETGAVIAHVYEAPGIYRARVTVSAGGKHASAEVTITVGDDPPPPPPPGGPSDNDADPFEGFGASTPGGAGGRVLRVQEPTEAAVRAAFTAAKSGRAIIRFETTEPIAIRSHLPPLTGDFVPVEGNGATLYVPGGAVANLIEVNGAERSRLHRGQLLGGPGRIRRGGRRHRPPARAAGHDDAGGRDGARGTAARRVLAAGRRRPGVHRAQRRLGCERQRTAAARRGLLTRRSADRG